MADDKKDGEFIDKRTIFMLFVISIVILAPIGAYYYIQHKDDKYNQFGLDLLDLNVALIDVYSEEDYLCIEYVPDVEDQFSAITEIGNIAFIFANHYEEYNVNRLLAKAVDAQRQLGATWECKGEWVNRYHEGNMSLNDLMWQCVSTIKVTED